MRIIRDASKKDVAIVLCAEDYMGHKDKRFFSEPEDTIQIGSLFFPTGSLVKPHLHKEKIVSSVKPIEVLLILRGVATATIYDDDKKEIGMVTLTAGDILIQKRGGHGFEFPSDRDTRILEVKSGPYFGRGDDKEEIE